MTTHPDLVAVALDHVEGFAFERFVNAFFPSIIGASFIPLGGTKDGGADAFGGDAVHEQAGSPRLFYQASVQEDFRAKIRHTVKRLREFGRDPSRLTYVTSQKVRYIDKEEDALTTETGVSIRIRDGGYLAAQIVGDPAGETAFEAHLLFYTDFLKGVGASTVIPASAHVTTPAVFVFLRQELDRRGGDFSLLDAVVDSLILWSLEGTDPDKELFMTGEEVASKIHGQLPAARELVDPRLRRRLHKLAAKDASTGRKVRWHKQDDLYCLPFETRKIVGQENLEDEALRVEVEQSFYARASSLQSHAMNGTELRSVARLTLRTMQLVFEREGLEFANFLTEGRGGDFPTVNDAMREALHEAGVAGKRFADVASAVTSVVRSTLYASTDSERLYLAKLARTYALFFTLGTEPRLVKYFQEMTADFYLYVGSDLLVRALSERYLPLADQVHKNTLLMAARAGSNLVLAAPVLEEVVSHLRATDFEFRNHFQGVEHRVTREIAEHAPKILLRAFFYNKINKRGATNWPAFVGQFCDYDQLHRPAGSEQLEAYFRATYSLQYKSQAELRNLADPAAVAQLTQGLMPIKADARLAENDALMACAVYGRRSGRREGAHSTEFGYKTWWLTTETKILQHTRSLVDAHAGTQYIMRPEFLLNFLALAPTLGEVRAAFQDVFPAALGMQLSKRMSDDSFHKMMKSVREAEGLEDGRRLAVMANLADQLKSDLDKRYTRELRVQ